MLNGANGMNDMAGEAVRVAVERSGSCRDTNAEVRRRRYFILRQTTSSLFLRSIKALTAPALS